MGDRRTNPARSDARVPEPLVFLETALVLAKLACSKQAGVSSGPSAAHALISTLAEGAALAAWPRNGIFPKRLLERTPQLKRLSVTC